MTTYNTRNKVGSPAAKDLFDNSENFDKAVNDRENEIWVDRLGVERVSLFGAEKKNERLIETFKVDMNTAIVAAGYITIDSFQQGADLPNNELTQRNHILRDETTGEYYRWDGDLPKKAPAGSTPQSTGGIGKGAWVSVGDASLRWSLSSFDGANLIAGGTLTQYKKIGSFDGGGDALTKRDCFLHSDGFWYFYDGDESFPVVVEPNSVPDSNWKAVGLLNGYDIGDVRNWGAFGDFDDTDALNKANAGCNALNIQVLPLLKHYVSGTVNFFENQNYSSSTFIVNSFPTQMPLCLISQDLESGQETMTNQLLKGAMSHEQMNEPNMQYFVVSQELYVNRYVDGGVSPVYKEEVLITNSSGRFLYPSFLYINTAVITKKRINKHASVYLPSVDTSGLSTKLYSVYRCARPNTDVYCSSVSGADSSVYCMMEARQAAMVKFFDLYSEMKSPNYTTNHWRVSDVRHYRCNMITEGAGSTSSGSSSGANGNVGREIYWHDSIIPDMSWHANGFNLRGFGLTLTNNQTASAVAQGHGGGVLGLYNCVVNWTRDIANKLIENRGDYYGGWDGRFEAKGITVNILNAAQDIRLASIILVSSGRSGAISKMPDVDFDGITFNNLSNTTSSIRLLAFAQINNNDPNTDWSAIEMPSKISIKGINARGMQVIHQHSTSEFAINQPTAKGKKINITFDDVDCDNPFTVDTYTSSTLINTRDSNIGFNYEFVNAGAVYPRLLTIRDVNMNFSGEKTIFCGIKMQTADSAVMAGSMLKLNSCRLYRARWLQYSDENSIAQAKAGRLNVFVNNCEMLSPMSVGAGESKECGSIVTITRVSFGNYADKLTVSPFTADDGSGRRLIQDFRFGNYSV